VSSWQIVSPEMVAAFVKGIWPIYAGGRPVTIERLPRADSCPVSGLVLWNSKAEGWHVLADQELDAGGLLLLLGHELGHVAAGDLEARGDGGLEQERAMFRGDRTVAAAVRLAGWLGQKGQAETNREEKAANRWAAEFVKTWRPVLDEIEQMGRQALKILKRGAT